MQPIKEYYVPTLKCLALLKSLFRQGLSLLEHKEFHTIFKIFQHFGYVEILSYNRNLKASVSIIQNYPSMHHILKLTLDSRHEIPKSDFFSGEYNKI